MKGKELNAVSRNSAHAKETDKQREKEWMKRAQLLIILLEKERQYN